MDRNELEASQKAREWFHSLTVPPGAWTVLRVDGRSFSRFTEARFDKPYDERFAELMTGTAAALLSEFDARYVYTQSDEISVLLDPSFDLFGRVQEKLVSISASVASSAFTAALGEPAQFDSRVWIGTSPGDVLDYFSWRQADATRNAPIGWCYWTLRKDGLSARVATKRLEHTGIPGKHELLFEHGINFNDLPGWQRRGTGLWHEPYERSGYDPIRKADVVATRRRVRTEPDLPYGDAYRTLLGTILAP